MLTHEYEALIHRYLDGELDASLVLKVEEHLRSSPESRAYHERLQRLSGSISNALDGLPRPGPDLESRVIASLRRSATEDTTAIRHLDSALLRIRTLRIAAAVVFAVIAVQIGLMIVGSGSNEADSEAVDTLRRRVAQLERENKHLRTDRAARLERRVASFDPIARVPHGTRPSAAETPIGKHPDARHPKTPTRPDKAEVFASIRGILDEFRSSGHWNLERQAEIMRKLALLGDLSPEDFRDLRHLFSQQDNYGPGQLFLAQVISRFFSHDPQAREFVYGKVESELNRLRRGGTGAMGDRVLRRAWTEGLAHGRDPRSLDYLREIGLYDLDWVNRENAIGALAHIGNEAALRRLGELAAAEKDAQLREQSLRNLYDLIYTDPTLGKAASKDLQRQMLEILNGEFGANGENFDSMYWALQIIRALGGSTQEFIDLWRRRNNVDPGGDPRGGNPGGIPLPDPPK